MAKLHMPPKKRRHTETNKNVYIHPHRWRNKYDWSFPVGCVWKG